MADWQRTTATVLDTLLASSITSLIVGAAYALLFPASAPGLLETVESRDIQDFIERSIRGAREWNLKSRTAGYFSRVTLPLLKQEAFRSGGSLKIRIQILDPGNSNLLQAYARFRSNQPGAAADWSEDRVRCEIYATVLAAAVCRSEAPLLDIEIGLSPAFWVLSLDMSDEVALMTGQDKGDPALAVHRGSRFYEEWCADFEAGFAECKKLRPLLAGVSDQSIHKRDSVTVAQIQKFFAELGLQSNDKGMIERVMRQHVDRKHNYA